MNFAKPCSCEKTQLRRLGERHLRQCLINNIFVAALFILSFETSVCNMSDAAKAAIVDDCLSDPSALPQRPLTVTETQYERWFKLDVDGKPLHDQYMFVHRNGLCIIGVAPTHPLLAAAAAAQAAAAGEPAQPSAKAQSDPPPPAELAVGDAPAANDAPPAAASASGRPAEPTHPLGVRITYNHSSADLERTKTTGKRKHQGMWLDPLSNLAFVYAGGVKYKVKGLVRAKLLELNDRLRSDASPLIQRPVFEGYVGILAPMPRELAEAKAGMVSAEVYLQKRGLGPDNII